jgi:hypothetical protein
MGVAGVEPHLIRRVEMAPEKADHHASRRHRVVANLVEQPGLEVMTGDGAVSRSLRRPASDLREESDIVSARPVLDDQVVFDPPDVDKVPRDGIARRW